MQKKWLGSLGWLIIVVVAFWGGRLTKLDTVKIEKVPGPESVIYKLDEIPLNAITAYLGVQGLEILSKDEAQKIRAERHIIWQSGYMEGYASGNGNRAQCQGAPPVWHYPFISNQGKPE